MWGAILPDVKPQHKKFGKPLNVKSFSGRINPDFCRPDFLKKLNRIERVLEENSHQILMHGRNRVRLVPFPSSEGKDENIVVKEFITKGFNKVKTIILPSKAQKAWWGGIALLEKNLPTPLPVAYLEKSRTPFIEESIYFSVLEKGGEEIRFLFRRLISDELGLLVRSLASHLRCCHEKGILHRDLSDGNILVKKNTRDEFVFFLVDTNRIRVKKRLGVLKRVKNLTRLGVPDACQRLFLAEYFASEKVKKWAWVWYLSSKKAYTWHVRLKKRLFPSREVDSRGSV